LAVTDRVIGYSSDGIDGVGINYSSLMPTRYVAKIAAFAGC
jgi:hypothetical protein